MSTTGRKRAPRGGVEGEARPGRPALISREAIAVAALDIGLDGATLVRIAARLGVDHSSLYRHARSRDDILLAAADLAIGRLDWRSETEDWQDYLRTMAEAVWDLYETHPGLAQVLRRLGNTPQSGIEAFAEAVRRLEAFGFSTSDAALVVDMIIDMTTESVSAWQSLQQTHEEGDTLGEKVAGAWSEAGRIDASIATALNTMAEVLRSHPRQWWRRKLEVILAGAATLRPPDAQGGNG
ncbi:MULTISPECIES: TetR/AcrR family transcriptional regulator C-terminal domain-containing protein [unclassified Shinella]|uniref:TetR/AcrR family transcriptional regulator n=1 Tax=unclassified Shinella TaxID=2643062 RepID=UPI00225D108F|nr:MULTISPECIES: TetR/AcrR family transcriptional regulator C-terminal domain-containing protein [unclassified Shinella]MCO5139659.1 TetR/AcrR family transcriptional regulator C-terminal domain-containing protein [Shinella sp.]MDC7258341.1 TetR/AcrR family transcriptional regulator C-terminal domain-containing protein [Shinella sp. YE25]CAI0334675.1 TetR family transcriptional regulator [Rhizobiaceae bacterium]CAK7260103.1 TetR/AcrR family transcriptional regulator, tetracycline repressor prote